MARNRKKHNTALIMSICFALLTLGALGTAILLKGETEFTFFFTDKDKQNSVSEESVSQQPSTSDTQENPAEEALKREEIAMPVEIKAGGIRPGIEFSPDGSVEEIKADIDNYIVYALETGLNSIFVDTAAPDGRLIYKSSQSQSIEFPDGFSPIDYIVQKSHEKGLFTIVKYYATANNFADAPKSTGALTSDALDLVISDARSFASGYGCDAIAIDGYYYPKNENTYAEYLKSGSFKSFEEYQMGVSEKYVSTIKSIFNENDTASYLGLITEPQWMSYKEDENGSKSSAAFSCKSDGNADILDMSDRVSLDFVMLDCYGSTEDKAVPFQSIVAWWNDALNARNIPFMVLHYTSKAVTEAQGWSEYDQISRQVIESRERPGFMGSIFDSMKRMKEDPKEFATKLVGYYGGSVKPEHIMTDLEIITPTKTDITSFDSVISFSGNTDPNTEATINGIKIETDKNGYFNLKMDLKEGDNTFKVEHKGKTKIYNIKRIVEVVRNVAPTGTLKVDGSTKLIITAEGYQDAELYAVIAGQKIPLMPDKDEVDESLRNTSYLRFKGTYTVPDATTTQQNLGTIEVFGTWKGMTKSKKGANIIINARALPSDGRPVIVTADLAETFPGNVASAYSDPNCFPIPKGSLDYAVGSEIKYSVNDRGKVKTYSFFKLASGLRVLTDDISSVSEKYAPVGNKISGVTVKADERHTKVIIATKQAVSYKTNYSSNKITFTFNYTDSAPQGVHPLSKNPLFRSLSFKGSTMTLEMINDGIFFGYTAYYENGNLVLRFNNPPPANGSSLEGTKVVIDPGHGAEDTGALGYLSSHPEKVINWQIAGYLEQELKDRGATVYKLPTANHNYSLKERVNMAEAYDPHIFMSVHNNSLPYSSNVSGTEAYYFNPFSYAFAQYTAQNVAQALGTSNRGGRFGYYYVTRSMQYPGILIEGGYMSNPTEYNKLVTPEYQRRMASAIANSVSSYFALMSKNVPNRSGTETIGNMSGAVTDTPGAEPGGSENSNDELQEQSSSSDSDKVILSTEEIEISVGEMFTLYVENEDEGKVLWEIDKEGIANFYADGSSPSEISIEGAKAGKFTIKAYFKGKKASAAVCRVTVTE